MQDSSSAVPVRVDSHNGVVLETSFQDGIRRETLRSLAQLANSTELALQVCIIGRSFWEAWHDSLRHLVSMSATSLLRMQVAVVDTREETQAPSAAATKALVPAGRSTSQVLCRPAQKPNTNRAARMSDDAHRLG